MPDCISREPSTQAGMPRKNEDRNTGANNCLDLIRPLFTSTLTICVPSQKIIIKKITGFNSPGQKCFLYMPSNFGIIPNMLVQEYDVHQDTVNEGNS